MRLFRYEDLLGNEAHRFNQMFEFFGFSPLEKFIGRHYARHYRAARRERKLKQVRKASSGQWRQYFTPQVISQFDQQHGDLIEKLRYQVDLIPIEVFSKADA